MKERVLKAFWSKGRKAWLPCTVEDICNRAGCDKFEASTELNRLAQLGLAFSDSGSKAAHKLSTWRITEVGKIEARAIIAAEEFAKGGA